MASPKILVQILITGTRILGKAFFEAGRQAVKNAKHSPQGALGSDVTGVENANTGSMTDHLTRQYRMTIDEANLILNVKREDSMEQILKNYDHLFKANSPTPKPDKPPAGKQPPLPSHSHYLQSKVFRARERIEAELQPTEPPTSPNLQTRTTSPGSPPPPPEMSRGDKS